jgi:hypothetical protein
MENEKPLKKGQKVWLVRMNDSGKYNVVPGTVTDPATPYVKIANDLETDSPRETIVVDARKKEVFRTERDALVDAISRSHNAAENWMTNARLLAARLAALKK